MKITRHRGLLLLAIWLLLTGLIALFNLSFTNLDLIMALLALAAGAVILLEAFNVLKGSGRRKWTMGMILLGVWLLLSALIALTGFSFDSQGIILGLLALIAGGLILIGR